MQNRGHILDMILSEEWLCDLVKDLSLSHIMDALVAVRFSNASSHTGKQFHLNGSHPSVTNGPAHISEGAKGYPRGSAAWACGSFGRNLESQSD